MEAVKCDFEDYCLTLFDTLYPGKDQPTFTRDLLSSSSGGL